MHRVISLGLRATGDRLFLVCLVCGRFAADDPEDDHGDHQAEDNNEGVEHCGGVRDAEDDEYTEEEVSSVQPEATDQQSRNAADAGEGLRVYCFQVADGEADAAEDVHVHVRDGEARGFEVTHLAAHGHEADSTQEGHESLFEGVLRDSLPDPVLIEVSVDGPRLLAGGNPLDGLGFEGGPEQEAKRGHSVFQHHEVLLELIVLEKCGVLLQIGELLHGAERVVDLGQRSGHGSRAC
eukprot:COSAG02_NODE_953_length_15689_cov_112.180564_8_plen_237_part_00